MKKSYIILLLLFLIVVPLYRSAAQNNGRLFHNNTPLISSSAVYDKIVFSRQESGDIWNIYIMDITGGNQTRLLSSSYKDYDPHFRYDGEKIVFGRGTVNPASDDIFVMNPDGSSSVNLTADVISRCIEPKWSWNGSQIVFSLLAGADDYDVYTMNADGTGRQAVVTGATNDIWPCFSPDGNSIVFERFIGSPANQKSKICIYSITAHTITDLTDGSNLDEMPFYSPDGKYIIFKRGTSATNIYRIDLTASSITNLTGSAIVNDAPSYSYDGTKIAWIVSSSGMNSAEIWIMNSDGTNKVQLTSNNMADFNPVFSPAFPAAPSAPVATGATLRTPTEFNANWNAVNGAAGYCLDVAGDAGFVNYITGFQNKDVLNVLAYKVTGLAANVPFYYRVRSYNVSGTSGNSNVITVQTAVGTETGEAIPEEFVLNQCYPNPFNPSTVINYKVPYAAFISIRVYDILGREVTSLVNSYKNPGSYSVNFNSSDYSLQSGVYFYSMRAGGYIFVKKMMLIK